MEEDLDGANIVKFYCKHIETRNHCIRDQVNKGRLEPLHCPTTIYESDVLTKIMKHDNFDEVRNKMGVTSLEHLSIYISIYIFLSL
jgi:hypothetical protein